VAVTLFFLILLNFRSFRDNFGAAKQMPGLLIAVPFFVAARAAQKKCIFAKKSRKAR
jgi:hypothetical protein